MKIAILGSAPSSVQLAPFGDTSFQIWACSPGTYSILPRCDAFFELHRWEPGLVGKAHTQKPWFSPEYVMWMSQQLRVWMYQAVPEIPNSVALPVDDLTNKYGTFFFTSSIAFMLACAIEDILESRKQGNTEQDVIALYGVDMAANEEYGYQRAGCQHFLMLASDLGIQIVVPPESDLLRPMPLYGISESYHWMIKNTARKRELEGRLGGVMNTLENAKNEAAFLRGALDDLKYQMDTWCEDRHGMGTSHTILAQSPLLRKAIIGEKPAEVVIEQPISKAKKPRK